MSQEKCISIITREKYKLLTNIKVGFNFIDEIIMKLIVSMIRPRLKYAALVWPPHRKEEQRQSVMHWLKRVRSEHVNFCSMGLWRVRTHYQRHRSSLTSWIPSLGFPRYPFLDQPEGEDEQLGGLHDDYLGRDLNSGPGNLN